MSIRYVDHKDLSVAELKFKLEEQCFYDEEGAFDMIATLKQALLILCDRVVEIKDRIYEPEDLGDDD